MEEEGTHDDVTIQELVNTDEAPAINPHVPLPCSSSGESTSTMSTSPPGTSSTSSPPSSTSSRTRRFWRREKYRRIQMKKRRGASRLTTNFSDYELSRAEERLLN